jgi:hypothetical protein
VGLRAGLDTEAREKIPFLCRGSNAGRPVCSQDTILTELAQSQLYSCVVQNMKTQSSRVFLEKLIAS